MSIDTPSSKNSIVLSRTLQDLKRDEGKSLRYVLKA